MLSPWTYLSLDCGRPIHREFLTSPPWMEATQLAKLMLEKHGIGDFSRGTSALFIVCKVCAPAGEIARLTHDSRTKDSGAATAAPLLAVPGTDGPCASAKIPYMFRLKLPSMSVRYS